MAVGYENWAEGTMEEWRSHSGCWVVIPIGFMTAALVMFAAAIQEKQTSKTLWDTNTNRSEGC